MHHVNLVALTLNEPLGAFECETKVRSQSERGPIYDCKFRVTSIGTSFNEFSCTCAFEGPSPCKHAAASLLCMTTDAPMYTFSKAPLSNLQPTTAHAPPRSSPRLQEKKVSSDGQLFKYPSNPQSVIHLPVEEVLKVLDLPNEAWVPVQRGARAEFSRSLHTENPHILGEQCALAGSKDFIKRHKVGGIHRTCQGYDR